MNIEWIDSQRGAPPGVTIYSPLADEAIIRLQADLRLPGEHIDILRRSNGMELYAGYFRLFAVGALNRIDAIIWNRPNCWKFSWGGRVDQFWCFGETAWGDQYAYDIDELNGMDCPRVYFLSAFSMSPKAIGSSFAQFWIEEFLPNMDRPYDEGIVRARSGLGQLDPNNHLVYVPSILLGGSETTNAIHKMDARSSMIYNGDIAVQLDSAPVGGRLKQVQQYEDEFQRKRLRLLWI